MAKSEVPASVRRAHIEKHKKLRAEGKSVPDLVYNGKRYFADNKGEKWGGWRLRSRDSHKAQGNKRRAQQAEKSLTVDQREDWYKRNFERIPQGMTARDIALQDQADEARDLLEAAAEARRQGKAYEHLSPLAGPEKYAGGLETVYNIDAADKTLNLEKSDKIATTKVLREQGVPMSRASAIQKRANKTPAPTMDGSRFETVAEDIKINKRPKANQLLKMLPKLL